MAELDEFGTLSTDCPGLYMSGPIRRVVVRSSVTRR